MGPASVFRAEYKTPNNITQHYTTIHTQLHHTIHIKVEAGSGNSREEEVTGLQENIATWALGQGVW